jgi:hypothetical protein
MDYSIASRGGYALVTDNETGQTLVTVPWKSGETMCFTVIQTSEDYQTAVLSALAMADAGIKPHQHLPEEVQHLATEQEEADDSDTSTPQALTAAAAAAE